ncbi:MAG: peptidylprolyl isomerase [Actinobacteria bacterium]|nr:peptidylprolyl isomerase [Actinomycetota bacterium]
MSKITASHILVDSEETATQLMEQVTTGENFAKLAQEYSKCPSGKVGGNLGQFNRGQMVKEFEDAAFALEPGSVTGPIRTQFGYHLIYRTA